MVTFTLKMVESERLKLFITGLSPKANNVRSGKHAGLKPLSFGNWVGYTLAARIKNCEVAI